MTAQANDNQPRERPTGRKDRWGKLGFLVVILLAAGVIYRFQLAGPQLKGWSGDLDKALTEAARRRTKVVVVFVGNPMSLTDKTLITDCLDFKTSRKVLNHLKYIRVRLDVKTHEAAALRYGVTESPTVLLLDSRGKVLKTHSGFMRDIDFCNDFLGVKAKDLTPVGKQPGSG